MRIDGVEAFAAYIKPHHNAIYDDIYLGPVEQFLNKLPTYDLIFLGDVAEHFEQEAGREILQKLWERTTKAILIATPLAPTQQGAVLNNAYETHRSTWTANTLRELFDGKGTGTVISSRYLLFQADK